MQVTSLGRIFRKSTLLLLLFSMAAIPFIRTGDSFHQSFHILYSLLALLTLALVLNLTTGSYFRTGPIDWMVYAWLLVRLAGAFTRSVIDPLIILEYLSWIVVYSGIRSLPSRWYLWMLLSMITACLLQTIYGYFQIFDIFESFHPVHHMTGSFRNQSLFTAFISIGAIMSFGFWIFSPYLFPGRNYLSHFVFPICSLALYIMVMISHTWAVWIALFAMTVVLLFIRFRNDIIYLIRQMNRSLRATAIIFVILVFCSALYSTSLNKKDAIISRALVWKVTLSMITQHPVTGNGTDTFRENYLYAQADYFKDNPESTYMMFSEDTSDPSNEYLKTIYENGMIGFLILLSLIILLYRQRASGIIYITYIAGAGLGMLCITGFFSYPFRSLPIQFFALILISVISGMDRERKPAPLYLRVIPILFIMALAAATGYYTQATDRCREAAKTGKINQALDIFGTYHTLLHTNTEYLAGYIQAFQTAGMVGPALQYARELAVLAPSSRLWSEIGDFQLQLGQSDDAESSYYLAYYMVPSKFIPLHRLMMLYVRNKDYDKATEIARMITEQQVKVKTSTTDMIKRDAGNILLR